MSNTINLTDQIKQKALALGFSSIGIAKAEKLTESENGLKHWLDNGYHGKMQYMENHFEKRLDPRLLVDDAKSVIVVSHNYYPKQTISNKNYKIARYAHGEDYHTVLKDKLKELLNFIEKYTGKTKSRVFTDSAPVLERQWAVRAGLGWRGKNTLLIQKGLGSYFFLAEIIINITLEYSKPFTTNHCGSCTRCIDACPTQAILPNQILDASKCISYLTIELKDNIPESFKNKWKNWIFGCDICQEVCPWNKKSKPHQETRFDLLDTLKSDSFNWLDVNTRNFNNIFKNSPIKRTKLKGLKRNIDFLNS